MTYFLVVGSEDGAQVSVLESDAAVKVAIAERGLTKFRQDWDDPNYWGEDECLLIRGEIVDPKPKTVVSDWDL